MSYEWTWWTTNFTSVLYIYYVAVVQLEQLVAAHYLCADQ